MLKIVPHPLPYWNDRPAGFKVDTIVIHSVYSDECSDPFDTQACLELFQKHEVASHYLIDREGKILQLVDEGKRAKHAGESRMPFEDDQREVVNDFSIGIELIATQSSGFAEAQYRKLALLAGDIMKRHPITSIVGHEHISPARKIDPGPLFDWMKFRDHIEEAGVYTGNLRFGGKNV